MNDKTNILLTISIPTYNRANYLDMCLSQICNQIKPYENIIELLVSNNNSIDNTEEIVYKYINQGAIIRYIKNENNIGPDRNIAQCFTEAKGKYVWVFGDDDILLDESIKKIVDEIKNNEEYGIIYVNSYGFSHDYIKERPKKVKLQASVICNTDEFIERKHFFMTFITGNICNKTLFKNGFMIDKFIDTNLIQLSWTLSALIDYKKQLIINDFIIAAKSNNTGSYALCDVFAKKYNFILNEFVKIGFSQKNCAVINKNLLCDFFPPFIMKIRSQKNNFIKEDYFNKLYPLYKNNLAFWLINVPIIKLPVFLAKIWFKVSKKIINIRKK